MLCRVPDPKNNVGYRALRAHDGNPGPFIFGVSQWVRNLVTHTLDFHTQYGPSDLD